VFGLRNKNKKQTLQVLAVRCGGEFVDTVTVGDDETDKPVGVILDRTNFYAEQGGQVRRVFVGRFCFLFI
jgi:alanyl-tRNA synthetase